MAYESYESFESVQGRLDEIVDAVGNDDLSLDEALNLYEEAVGLGLRASDLLEEGIDENRIAEVLAKKDALANEQAPQAESPLQNPDNMEYAEADDSADVSGESGHSDSHSA